MLVSLKWLKEYVDIGISPSELVDKLTMAGLEVESMRDNESFLSRRCSGKDPFSHTSSPGGQMLSLSSNDRGGDLSCRVWCG